MMFAFMNVTRALSDENRVRILAALDDRELCVCQIIDLLGLSPSTVSKHLSILRNARLITGRKAGRWMYYRIMDRPVPEFVVNAIAWTIRSTRDDRVIRQDRHRLEELLSRNSASRCSP